MKIAIVQMESVKGNLQQNITHHQKLIEVAVAHGATAVIFPELSLTGYEPTLAQTLATDPDDPRFDLFQDMSDAQQVMIGVGMPTCSSAGICISMIIFRPRQPRETYSKKYLHLDEEPFFVSGRNFPVLNLNRSNLGLAICYELSVPEHAEAAFDNGAEIYIASVAKSMRGVQHASGRLGEIARTYGVPVLMSNNVGPSDDFVGAGQSAVWNPAGKQVAQLGETEEGLIIYDTESGEIEMIVYEESL